MSFLELRQVTVGFPNQSQAVLRDVTLSVSAQGLTFVIGPSGAGKSVLCKAMVGLLPIRTGEILLEGQSVALASEVQLLKLRRSVPYLVQSPALFDTLTAKENILFARTAAEQRTALEEWVPRLGLERYLPQLPAELGPGIQKRISLARALAANPRFLILDEPTTGLDPTATSQVLDALTALRAQGLGALVISHDWHSVRRLADQVIVVEAGGAQRMDPEKVQW